MRRVYQTETGPGGNCYAACLASLLDLPLAAVPDLRARPDWGARLAAWLAARGWRCEFRRAGGPPPPGWAILGYRTLTGSVHAALCRDGGVRHDPSPRPYPISTPVLWTLLRPNDESGDRLLQEDE